MMRLKNRLIAGALAFMVTVSSMPVSAGTVRAEELKETEETSVGTEETGTEEDEVSESILNTVEDDSKETETAVESIEVQEKKDETHAPEFSAEETENRETVSELEETEEIVGTEESEEQTETAEILAVSEDDIASGSYNNTTWVIDANGKLTVEGTGDFKRLVIKWDQYKKNIVSAEINVIGATDASYMFQNCSNLTKVDLSGFDTSKVTNMEQMFYGCSNLEYVDVSGFDTSKVTNMSCMFNECRKLKKVDVSGFDTSKVTDMSWMFRACNSLTNIDVSGFDTSRVTNMRFMFGGCSITSMDISNFDVSRVTDMDYIFYCCSFLKDVKMNVTGVPQYIFQECDSLESAEINVTGETDLNSLFINCKSLKNVEIRSNDTGKVTNMATMFSGCSSLRNVDFSGFDTKNVTNMRAVFAYCSSLESVDLSGFDTGKVTTIKNIFYECSQLTSLYTPCNLNVSEELTGIWYQSDGSQISSLPQNLDYSIFIMKDQIPSITDSCVKVMKKKTVYECGDALNVNDLTVRYYDNDGTSKIVTDYTTNADDIDMSISGIKTLTVTYNGFSAEVKLTVNEKQDASGKENVKITRISMPDTVYTGKETGYIGTAVVKSQSGKDITDMVKLIYTYSGIMADNSVYMDTEKAPVDVGDYKLTVEVSEDDENYTGSREYNFKVIKAPVKISALDVTIDTGSSLPTEYKYQVSGLLNDDVLITEPSFTCNADTTRGGRYTIVPSDADAGMNYEITYVNGTLSVESELHGSYGGIIWDIDSNGRLIVEGTGNFSGTFGTDRAPWYQYRENIKSAEISIKGITDASYMFAGLNNLTSLDLRELDTSVTRYMDGMFADCSSLNELDLSSIHTDNVISMLEMFQNCSNLKNLDLSNFNTGRVIYMRSMFEGCSGLSSLDLTNFDTSKVEDMSAMFWGCSGLTDIDLTNFNTGKVKNMGYMFIYCSGLVSIDLTNFNTENVTYMADMFSHCTSLINIDLSRFDTSKVTDMSSLFDYCLSLPDLELGNFDTSNVTDMHCMFKDCVGLESIDLSNFNTGNVTYMFYMFSGCLTLTDLDLSNFDTSQVTTMQGMFDRCLGLKSIDLSSFDTSKVTTMYNMFRDCSSLTSLELSNFNTSNVTTMFGMFDNCKSLRSLDLSSFDTSKVTSTGGMLDRCNDLIIIHTPCNLACSASLPINTGEIWYQQDGKESSKLPQNLDHSIVMTRSNCIAHGSYEDITWVIDAEGKLIVEGTGEFTDSTGENRAPWHQYREDIKSAEINVKGMTNAAYMFYGCRHMASMDLSKSDVSEVTDMSYMFGACDSLTNLDLSSFNVGKVSSATDMFSQCNKLTTICTPKNLTLSVSLPVDSDDTWYQQDGTKLLTLPQNLSYSIIIARNELPVITIDNIASGKSKGVTWTIDREGKLIAKGKGNFSNSNKYNRAPWYDYRTDIKSAEIDIKKMSDASYMFYGCSNLEKVNIDNLDTGEVVNIKYIFNGCSSLTGLDLSSFNTGKIKNMKSMFNGCSSLISLDLSSFDTSKVIDMSSMFSECSSLESINLSSFDTCKVQDMTFMFKGCSSLISLDLSNFDTSRVINVGMIGMFEGCSNLTSLDLSSFNTSGVSDMELMFADCSNLTSLDLSSFDTSYVWGMGAMFAGCSNLTSLDLSSFDTSYARFMMYMFSGCSNLTSLDLGNFDTSKVNNIRDMFNGCSSLTNLDLSSFDMKCVSADMSDVFKDCDSLTIIHTPYNLNYTIDLPVDLENIWYTSDGVAITELPKNLENSVTIKKDKIPNTSEPYIVVEKVKTIYELGEILYTDDLTVKYYDAEGTVRIVTDYTTNADDIDMSTSGTKPLIVTYGEYTTEVLLVVKGKEMPVEISGITVSDSVYTGKPFAYIGTAMVTTDAGVDVTTDISLNYTYTGTTADGKAYEASTVAPVNAGNYKLTIVVTEENSNYKGSAEYSFKITKAPIEITASNIIAFIGNSAPISYKYQVKGLLNGDELITEPLFTCDADTTKAGTYEIIPRDADAGMNYEITYTNGTLIVKEETGEKENVIISKGGVSDSAYTGKPYNGNVSVKLQDGLDITDSVTLTYSYSGTQDDGSSYGPSENAPVNTGTYTLTVLVAQNDMYYAESAEYSFSITKASVTVAALDKVFEVGKDTSLPAVYPYEVTGLLESDTLTTEPSFTYTDMDGKEISRDNISLTKAGRYDVLPKEADAGMNYAVSYRNGTLIIKEAAGNLPSGDKNSEVLPEDIPQTGIPTGGTIWTSAVKDQSYTGAAIKPDIRVYFDNKRLTEKADYTVAYKNNKMLGQADIIITGKGNYKDKKTVHFNIVQKPISDKDVIIEDMAYANDGKQHKAAPNVIYNGKKLKLDTDFTIEYGSGDYTTAGDYYATISGKGNYKGTYDKVKTTIIDKNMLLNKAKITKIPNQEYNKGQEITLPDSAIKVTLNGNALTKDTDYTVDYVNNCNAGKASVVIRGKGKYAGTKTASFKIVRTPVNIGEADVSCDFNKEMFFVKGGCMPVPTVSCNGEILRNGTDYTVSYKNNKKCGPAALIVKGKGSFKGSRTFEFTVNQKELSAVDIRVPDIVYVNKAGKYQSKPILTDTDGNILKAGTDYTVTGYAYNGKALDKQDCPPEGAEITVTVQGNGSYKGTCTASYKLKAGTGLSKAKITIADQSYTGTSVKPTQSAITGASIKANGGTQNLVYGRDYEIAAYGSNIKKGSGTVVLRGLGSYYGEKTVKFKIVEKSVE